LLEKLPDVVGHVLRGQRAGLGKTAFQAVDLRAGMAALTVSTKRFPGSVATTDGGRRELEGQMARQVAAAAAARARYAITR
jgi:hypothetical protein